ncbi:MAG: hypothetical protein Q8O99_08105 [bacterium]|nr:hypothetical protein [bacterium]
MSVGSGLSPNFGLFQHLVNTPTKYDKIVTMFGERYASELIPEVQNIFYATASDRIKHLFFLSKETSFPEDYRQGHIQDGLEEAVQFLGMKTSCFVCGNPIMVNDIVVRLQAL